MWININKNITTCGLLGNNNGYYKDDIKLRNGTILNEFNDFNINLLGDSWMIPYDNQPLSCDYYPNESYIKFMSCNINRKQIENKCDKIIKSLLNNVGGKNVDKCFLNYKLNLIDATRLYDDCITQLCYKCKNIDNIDCKPTHSIQLFKKVCMQNNVTLSL